VTTGWDTRDGSRRIQCNSVGVEGSFKPKVFCGRVPWPGAGQAPTVAIGAGDLSYEVWARRKFGNSPGSDFFFFSGIVGDASWQAAMNFHAGDDLVDARFDEDFDRLGIDTIFNQGPEASSLWSHYAVNCDRDGNMELFIDVESKGTVDISAQNSDLGSVEVHPLVGEGALYGNDAVFEFEAWTQYTILPVMVGPFAVHNRLLTTAEMEDSYRFRKVNSLGSGTTLVLYDWDIVDETGWDFDVTHLYWGIRAGLAIPYAMPTGTAARVLDKSGNENHWTLPGAASYGATRATWATVAFGTDPFFRGGG
jgi:hypothetical protein